MDDTAAEAMEVEDSEIPTVAADDAPEDAGGGAASEDKSRSSDSDSSSDSESDGEAAAELQIKTLEKALVENPLNYEAQVQYINCLRKLGHIEKLRQARESMSEHFPLSPKMWQEWTKDEASLRAGSSEAFAEIEKLYERGVHEYLSVPLWCDYIDFLQQHDISVSECAPAGVSKMRSIFECALTAAGLHVVEGNKIWEAYREYEQAIFLTIDDSNSEEKTKQVQRIRALFHRQLSVPLVDLKTTLANYKLWELEQGNVNDIDSELDGVPANVVSAYRKATEMSDARKVYEDQLSKSDATDAERLQYFLNYLTFEESSGDPVRVQILYERAVTEFPISSDLWLGYTSYLDKTLKVPNVVKSVYSRATRNCTWVGDLWTRYMLSLERLRSSEKELSAVFEQSMQCAFPSFKEYLELFLNRVDGLRRRISSGAKEDGLEYTLIRDTFQRAVEYLSPQLVSTDDLLRLHAYWARLESTLAKDLTAARGVWESLIKRSGSILEVWQGYISMEIEMGHVHEARSIYKRCYAKRFLGTGSEDICHSWMRFEREYGTLDDLDLAVKKVTPRLQELMMFKTQEASKSISSVSAKKDSSVTTGLPQKRRTTDNLASAKRPKNAAPEMAEAYFADPVEKSGNAIEAGIVHKGEVASASKVAETAATDEQPGGGNFIPKEPKAPKANVYTDQCTAFISNISLEANENHLRELFADCGGITAIRLLRDKFTGKSRGLAYVDFIDDEHLSSALAKNKQKLLGQRLSIARSDPKQSKKRASTTTSFRGHGRGARFRSEHSGSAESAAPERHGSSSRPSGRNTFAVPRSVARPLGWSSKQSKVDESTTLTSNDAFREALLKK